MLAQACETNRSIAWYADAQRQRTISLGVMAFVLSVAFAGLIVRLEIIPTILVGVLAVVVLVLRRPQLGLYLVYFLDLLIDGSSVDPLMRPLGRMYDSVASGAIVTPFELLLVLAFVAVVAHGIATQDLRIRAGDMKWLVLLFFGSIVYGFARGASSGGDAYIGLWEARSLLLLCFSFVVASTTMRSRRQVQVLLALTLVATGLFAIEGAYRRIALMDTGIAKGDLVFAHEDAVFLSIGILLVLLQQIFGGPAWRRVAGLVFLPIIAFTLMASQRRAGMIALMIDLLVFAFVFLFTERKLFLKVFLPILVCGLLYLPLFWNNTSLIGQPARAVRSQFEPNTRDASSDLYRKLEKVDVEGTVASDPLLGIGFGREFLWVVPLPNISNWPFWRYEPHHNILWVWLKTGWVGFTVFWAFMGAAIASAVHQAKTLRDEELRVSAFLVLGIIVGVLTYAYVDTGLVASRLTVLLGIWLGTLSVLRSIPQAQPARARSL